MMWLIERHKEELFVISLLLLSYIVAIIIGRGKRITSKGAKYFLIGGVAIALVRFCILWYLEEKIRNHAYTENIAWLRYFVILEGQIVAQFQIENSTWHLIAVHFVVLLTSLLWAVNLLVVGAEQANKNL